ncbi:pentatricopeptide repeat-containing protein [Acrasis kona]|uniref:Pentatricopeptide repeat-containing protein n=1 Tax=Acrasis kona TaxID=1008807 RepID=A0AAW2ZBB3_9EUKA
MYRLRHIVLRNVRRYTFRFEVPSSSKQVEEDIRKILKSRSAVDALDYVKMIGEVNHSLIQNRSINAVVYYLVKQDKYDLAESLIESSKITRDTKTYNILIEYWFEKNCPDRANHLMTQMLCDNVRPDASTLTIAFSGYMRLGMLDNVLRLINEMYDEYNIQPSDIDEFVTFANVLIRELCKQ